MAKGPPLFPIPVGSYSIVLAASIMHIYQGLVIFHTYCADENIPLHSLLFIIPMRAWLALWMILASLPAVWGLWKDYSPLLTSLLVIPQGLVVLATSLGAYVAIWLGRYFNFDPGCAAFVGTDQWWQAAAPFLYAAAVWQITKESAFNTQIRALRLT